MIRAALLTLACLAVSPVWAINKCTGSDGKTVFQDAPCTGATAGQSTSTPVDTKVQPNVMRPEDIARSFDAQLKEEANKKKAVPPNDGVNWGKVREEMNERKQAQGVIRIGMTAAEARSAWGEPSKINRTTSANGHTEQWVFYRGRSNTDYVYLRNDVVTSTQTSN